MGKLLKMGTERGWKIKSQVKIERGGNPESVKFFRCVGMNYVSRSAFRVPIALLAAAQAAIESAGGK